MKVFATGSYSGATTAEIAREAGISEPILYRHFASKRELYFACLDEAWSSFRSALDAKLAELGDSEAVTAIGQGFARVPCFVRHQAGDAVDPGTDGGRRRREDSAPSCAGRCVRCTTTSQPRLRRAQVAGGVPQDRDPDAEAWVFVGGVLLLSFADRLGGLIGPEDLVAIATQRRRWLTGTG